MKHFTMARSPDGVPYALRESSGELVFLAFDTKRHCFCELHLIKESESFSEAARKSFLERASHATDWRNRWLLPVLDCGFNDGMAFYSMPYIDGEWGGDYITRVGPLPGAASLAIVHQMAMALMELQKKNDLFRHVSLAGVKFQVSGEGSLVPLLGDYGLYQSDEGEGAVDVTGRILKELGEWLYFLLTGQTPGEEPDFSQCGSSTPAVKSLLRLLLSGHARAPQSLESFLLETAACHAELAGHSDQHAVNGVLAGFVPDTAGEIATTLFPESTWAPVLGQRYEMVMGSGTSLSNTQVYARDRESGRLLALQFMPPSSVLPRETWQPMDPRLSSINERDYPNLLRVAGLWESTDFSVILEDTPPALSLAKLLSHTGPLPAKEGYFLLKKVSQAIEQAISLGLPLHTLYPDAILLAFLGDSSGAMAGEAAGIPLSRWTPFELKVRCHTTLPHFLRGPAPESHEGSDQAFFKLALLLLVGGGDKPCDSHLPESVRNLLKEFQFLRESPAGLPSKGEFLERLRSLLLKEGYPQDTLDTWGELAWSAPQPVEALPPAKETAPSLVPVMAEPFETFAVDEPNSLPSEVEPESNIQEQNPGLVRPMAMGMAPPRLKITLIEPEYPVIPNDRMAGNVAPAPPERAKRRGFLWASVGILALMAFLAWWQFGGKETPEAPAPALADHGTSGPSGDKAKPMGVGQINNRTVATEGSANERKPGAGEIDTPDYSIEIRRAIVEPK